MSGEVEDFWCINETDQADEKKETRKLVKQKLTLTLSLSHTCLHSCICSYTSYLVEKVSHWTMAPSVLCVRFCAAPAWIHVFTSESRRGPRTYICLSVCVGPDVSQKQHITRLSLHPEEGLFRSRMLLAELRRIFLTVSLLLTDGWENIPTNKGSAESQRCSALNVNAL